jgi:hypothetical protein
MTKSISAPLVGVLAWSITAAKEPLAHETPFEGRPFPSRCV